MLWLARNRVNKLRKVNGSQVVKKEDLFKIIIEIYQNLFREEEDVNCATSLLVSYPVLSLKQNQILSKRVIVQEMKKALFSIGRTKALGEDGMPTIFFQKNWDIMGRNVCDFVKETFLYRKLKDVNKTFLVFISKIEKLTFINHFKPISLCNVVYKCVMKILVNRLKPMLSHLISPFQLVYSSKMHSR